MSGRSIRRRSTTILGAALTSRIMPHPMRFLFTTLQYVETGFYGRYCALVGSASDGATLR